MLVSHFHFTDSLLTACLQCGNELCFNKITDGFAFLHGRQQAFEMFCDKSGYNLVPGTAVCLTNTNIMKKRKKKGKNNAMKNVRDATYGRMLALNVSNKEKSQYVKIWKALMDKYTKKTT